MAEIKIGVAIDKSGLQKAITDLNTSVSKASVKPIEIKLKVDGSYKNVTSDLLQLARAQAELAAAQAKADASTSKQNNSMARLATGAAKLMHSLNEVTLAQERSNAEALKGGANLLIQQEKTRQQQEKTQQGALRLANTLARTGSEAAGAASGMDMFAAATMRVSESMTSMVKRTVFNAIRREIRETISTMREMDSQLTTIKRVAGISDTEAARYQSQAYEMGSKYGVKPGDYLADVVAFTRAGYGELAPQLGELATKMQVVGEVSQETATQMMLSVDAAYKYEGNTEKLSAVIDGANEVGDHYATNMEKIAQGLGIVAPIAAQVHVGIDELTAALGTITAVTQRSGSEAARALRYVFLNIVGNTKEEIEDGVTLTEEEITGMHDMLVGYANDGAIEQMVEGQVVNPMRVLEQLHNAVKAGLIDETELMGRVEKFAGKLRASQLLALIRGWDTHYTGMLETFANAAGSADAKVGVVLTGWEAKANMLSASFTKLFSDVLGSNVFKGGLDALTGFVKLLDVGEGSVARVVAMTTAFTALAMTVQGIAKSSKFASFISMLTNPTTLAIAGGAAAFAGIIELFNYINNAQERREDAAIKAQDSYTAEKNKLIDINTELEKQKKIIDELTAKQTAQGGLTDAEAERLRIAKEYTVELERQYKIQQLQVQSSLKEAAEKAYSAAVGSGRTTYTGARQSEESLLFAGSQDINNTVWWLYRAQAAKRIAQDIIDGSREGDINQAIEDLTDVNDTIDTLSGYIMEYRQAEQAYINGSKDYYDSLTEKIQQGGILDTDEQAIYNYYGNRVKSLEQFDRLVFDPLFGVSKSAAAASGGGTTAGGTGGGTTTQQFKDFTTELKNQTAAYNKLKEAQKQYNETGVVTKETMDALKALQFDLYEGAMQDGEGFRVSGSALEKALKGVADWFEDYGQDLPDLMDEVSESPFADIAGDVLQLADAANIASKALEELKKNLKADGETGDTFDAYASEFSSVGKLAEGGNWGSKELRGFLALAMDQDQLAGAGSWSSAYKQFAEGFGGAALGDTTGLAGMDWLLKKMPVIRDEMGNMAASFEETNDGWKIMINDASAAAKALGVSEEVFVSWAEKMGLYQDAATDTINKNKEVGDSAEQTAESVSTAADETAKAAETMDEATGGEGKPGEGEGATIPVQVEGLDELQRVLGVLTDATGARHQVIVSVMADGDKQIYDLDGTLHEMAEGETVETVFTADDSDLHEKTEQAEQYLTTVYENGNRTVELVGDAESVKKAAEEAAAAVGDVPEEKETKLEGDASSAKDAAEEAGQAIDGVEQTRTTQFIGNSGGTVHAVDEARDAIEEVPGEKETDFRGDASGTQDASNKAQNAVEDVPDGKETDFTGDASGTQNASNEAQDAIERVDETHDTSFGGDATDLETTAMDVINQIGVVDEESATVEINGNKYPLDTVLAAVKTALIETGALNAKPSITANGDLFTLVYNSVMAALGVVDAKEADPTISATDNATSVIAGVQNALSGLKDKTIKINVEVGSGVHLSPTGGEHGGGVGGHFASGTIDAPGGLSLVNELGPEIIAQDGRAFVANGGNPGIVELKPHAIVFDAEDTRQILAGHSLTGRGIMSNAAPLRPVGVGDDGEAIVLNPIDPRKNKDKDKKKKGGGGGGGGDTTDWWAIIEAHYKYVKETAEHAIKQLDYQIKVLKNAWEDEKTPIQEQIDALKEINETISRQITLIKRERDAALKPLDDEIDALKKAKETQDEQLELAEKQKAVEEAKAELETANQERTIRFFNKETGHWEWRADQERIADAEEKVKSAEKALADYEYEMQIRELERQRDALSAEYDEQIQVLEDQKLANEDTIYDLNQKLKDLEKKYQALIKPLEQEKDQRQRALEEAEYEWSELEFKRREKAEGSLAEAVSHTGKNGKTANSIISEVKADMKDIKAAFSGTDRDAIAAIIAAGIMYGPSSGADLNTSSISNIGGTDSHNQTVIINGLTVTGEAADKIIEAAGDLGIYAGE